MLVVPENVVDIGRDSVGSLCGRRVYPLGRFVRKSIVHGLTAQDARTLPISVFQKSCFFGHNPVRDDVRVLIDRNLDDRFGDDRAARRAMVGFRPRRHAGRLHVHRVCVCRSMPGCRDLNFRAANDLSAYGAMIGLGAGCRAGRLDVHRVFRCTNVFRTVSAGVPIPVIVIIGGFQIGRIGRCVGDRYIRSAVCPLCLRYVPTGRVLERDRGQLCAVIERIASDARDASGDGDRGQPRTTQKQFIPD